jgi:hypothetical protein
MMFTLSSTTITISAGNTTGTATLTGVSDLIVEDDESIMLIFYQSPMQLNKYHNKYLQPLPTTMWLNSQKRPQQQAEKMQPTGC